MIKINWNEVDVYLQAGSTGTEVAALFGIHANTLYERCKLEQNCDFSEYRCQKREKGLARIKLQQFEKALNGDTTMLIWLGKVYLEQSEKRNIESIGVTAINIIHTTVDDNGETLSTETIENVNMVNCNRNTSNFNETPKRL
jgi:hypothetical protein